MENVPQIQPYQGLKSWNKLPEKNRKTKKSGKKADRITPGRFHHLSRMADDIHTDSFMKNSPVRFCVYQNNKEMLLDVVAVDRKSDNNLFFSRSIAGDTHPEMVRKIHTQKGLLFDFRL